MRNIIQITANKYGVYALCDDGTLWWMESGGDEWLRVKAIPV